MITNAFQSGVFPHRLKVARVVPIYKAGSKKNVNNYRPISVLPSLSKLFEKLLLSRLLSFLDKHYSNQYGFRKKHSTTHALLDTVTKCFDAINQKQFYGILIIDLKKAFDTVSHDKLIKKLNHYGIRGVANDLISSCLHNRKQFAALNDVHSTLRGINMGVPQGSILDPLLYIIYVGDLPNAIECSAKLNADDTCSIFSDNCLTKLEQKISGDSKKLKTWLDANSLSMNLDKTACIIIPPSHNYIHYNFNPTFNESLLKIVRSYKYLEITVDNQLKFKFHIQLLKKKISCGVGIL